MRTGLAVLVLSAVFACQVNAQSLPKQQAEPTIHNEFRQEDTLASSAAVTIYVVIPLLVLVGLASATK